MHSTKYIVITGGVMSGLGKGIATASIGHLFSPQLKVVPIKCDGYLNTDPGTMNPFEHGEVFVLDDGGEVDMDFGHYERFMDIDCKFDWNLTMGKVYERVIRKERRGDYAGATVQLIPHVSNEIKDLLQRISREEESGLSIIEIGGTVGDIENRLYIEAVRQLRQEVGPAGLMFLHLGYIPKPPHIGEPKTKPLQQSVDKLGELKIIPNIIIGRCEEPLPDRIKEKLSLFCGVNKESIIDGVNMQNIYEVPLSYNGQGLTDIICSCLGINADKPRLEAWTDFVQKIRDAKKRINIVIGGKYTKLADSYASIIESLTHAGAHLDATVEIDFLETTGLEKKSVSALESELKNYSGILIPGGFGERGAEGKMKIIEHARKNNVPFLGLCYGMQLAVVEYARNVCGLPNAASTEIDPDTEHPVICIMAEHDLDYTGGTLRKGAFEAELKKGTLVHKLYACGKVHERHRHRYEVNPKYHALLEEKGLIISGISPDGRLAEFIELKEHPFFAATQAHPEFKSRPLKPAPLFLGFLKAALAYKK